MLIKREHQKPETSWELLGKGADEKGTFKTAQDNPWRWFS